MIIFTLGDAVDVAVTTSVLRVPGGKYQASGMIADWHRVRKKFVYRVVFHVSCGKFWDSIGTQ